MDDLKNLIHIIRGKQVILDNDVAKLYNYETRVINQTVKRNIARFSENFCFKLTYEEYESLISQIVTSKITFKNKHKSNKEVLRSQFVILEENSLKGKHTKYLPYAFTEKGIIMLAGLLKNDIAIEASVRIVNAFVEMKKFITNNADIFKRLTTVEYKLLDHDEKFNEIIAKLEPKEVKEQLFYDGQIYDAYSLIVEIFEKAKKEIVIIDNYIDKKILDILVSKQNEVNVIVITKNNNLNKLDIENFSLQYGSINIAISNRFHDRFIIIDGTELYHIGASLKDLGKKCFGITKIEDIEYLRKLNKIIDNNKICC